MVRYYVEKRGIKSDDVIIKRTKFPKVLSIIIWFIHRTNAAQATVNK